MDDLEEQIRARLVDLIGTGKVAVVDGPLADPMVIEAKPLFEDSSLAWALQRYREHAANLSSGNASVGSERARRPVSILYITPIDQVHVIVEPTSARDVQGPARTKLNVPLLQPHHVHHRHQRIGNYAISDFLQYRQHVTLFLPGAERYGARFAGKGYRYAFDGVGYARKGKYLLVNGDHVPVADYDAQRAEVMQVKREAPVVLRYAFADGITLTGNTKLYKDRIRQTAGTVLIARRGGEDRVTYRFEWSRRQQVWYVPKSRNVAWSRAAVDEVAEALRIHGIPNVEVQYQSPREVGAEPAFEPSAREPEPTPHGWPPIPLDDATAKLMPEAQLRALPRYTAEDYRWHDVQLGRLVTPVHGFATNILGHFVVAHPPSEPLSRFWVLVVDGERWGRGQEDFFVLANNFHAELVPTLEPLPLPRRVEPVDDDEIAAARPEVAKRKARSRALDDVARAAGIEVCPRAIFEIEPVPADREQIKERARAFADLVHRYRELHAIELWAAGKLDRFPRDEALALNNHMSIPRGIGDDLNAPHSVEWAHERYTSWVETILDVMKPRDRERAAHILNFCVRDVAGGRRRAREGRQHERPAEPLELLEYRAPERAPATQSRVVAPAPASEQRVAEAASATARTMAQSKKVASVAAAWSEHVASRPKDERPWSNVPKTSCFVRKEQGVDVTLCPTPQARPVENCPPLVTTINDKARRVMLCGGDDGVLFFGSVADANLEGENMALRKRLRQASSADEGWPAVDDFAAQERFLDGLVPARLVFEKDRPFTLLSVEVGPPRVSAGTESADVTKWADRELPVNAELEPQVLVGGRATGLREFVDALGDELFVYRGQASQATIRALLEHLPPPQRLALERKGKTANDIGHGIFDGRSLYWLGDQSEFVGPVFANGRLASGRAKEEVLERLSQALRLPESLPHGWTLEDSIVIAGVVGGEPAWSVWNSPSASFSFRRESQDAWTEPKPLAADPDPESGTADFAGSALQTLNRMIDGTPATIRFRVAGAWLGMVFPSDYGSRIVFDAPTGGKLDLDRLERERNHFHQLSTEDADYVEDYRQARRRVEWAQKWLSQPQGTQRAATPKRPPTAKPKLTVVRAVEEPAAKPEPAKPQHSRAPNLKVVPTDAVLAEFAQSLGVTRDGGHTVGDRIALLYEAEKRGWGPKMRTWLVKNRLIKADWATEYGARARGRLAFERGEPWPPPPARGDTYSATEYAGILSSLPYAPEAQAAAALGKQWTEAMARMGATRFFRHYDLDRDVRRQFEVRNDAAFDNKKTVAAARARYDRMKAALDALTQAMRLSMDPSLYDKSREAAQVYKTLCEISNDVAKEVLEELYGVGFVDRDDHYALCDGKQSLADLDHKVSERAREDAAQKAESDRVRLADARALLAVADDASKRGELTEKRFNTTYWRLHPEISGYARESRRLKLTWFPSFRQARGVAPASSDKPTEAWVRGPSDHGFHAKVYKAAGEVAVVEALVAAIRREAAELEAKGSSADAPSSSTPAASKKPKRARKPPTSPEPAEAEPTMTTKRSSRRAKTHTPAAEPPRSKPVDAEKLRALADSMEAKANTELGVDRLENTPRRAQMAAGIRDRARRQLVLAQTLRRIADAGEAGGYQYVSQVSNKADLDALETELDRAGYERRKAEGVFEYWKRDEPQLVDIDHATYEGLRAERDNLVAVLEFTKSAEGLADSRRVLDRAAKRLTEWGPLRPEEIEALRELVAVVRKSKAKDIPRPVEAMVEALRDYDRLEGLGVVDTPSLRAALSEYMTCCRAQTRMQKDDPIAVKKRELAFAKIPGFFPTPRPLVERMVDAAELGPRMRVLEPSAGDGAIALVIRERHPDVVLDVIERQFSLRELLEAQGFSLVAADFTAYTPAAPYDRILMNPPFEQKQDVEHIDHAIELLAPGGRLVAIASAGLNFRDDPKTKALRDRIDELGGYIEPLPQGSFEASGTSVSTVLVVVDKPSAAARREPAQASTPRPQPRSEPMSDCSVDSPSACQPKPMKPGKPSAGAKAKLAAEVAKQEATAEKAAKPAKKRTSKKKTSQAKPSTDATTTSAKAPSMKASGTSKKTSSKKTSSKKTSSKKTSSKKAPSHKAPGKKASSKKKASKLPNWRYTTVRSDRYRYREVAGLLVVEREKDGTWTGATASAARAVHEKSQSACALAAQILPTCGTNKSKPSRLRPTDAQKQAMRKFLGL